MLRHPPTDKGMDRVRPPHESTPYPPQMGKTAGIISGLSRS